jgi:hypothetical protein
MVASQVAVATAQDEKASSVVEVLLEQDEMLAFPSQGLSVKKMREPTVQKEQNPYSQQEQQEQPSESHPALSRYPMNLDRYPTSCCKKQQAHLSLTYSVYSM